jgi:iron complex outermembrane receptor protein
MIICFILGWVNVIFGGYVMMWRHLRTSLGAFLLSWIIAFGGHAGEFDPSQFTLEDLMSIELLSASKKLEALADSASAVYIITADDIRRAGVSSLADALRLAPGVQVSSIDGNKWTVSIRGFNAFSSNKLLVMIDGRSVYDGLLSGVFWDVQDTMLADVDRIEVVRGPGASLWGANAVNGVINIITRSAFDTTGELVDARIGTDHNWDVSARYGVAFNDDHAARLWVKKRESNESHQEFNSVLQEVPGDTSPYDSSKNSSGGFRYDGVVTPDYDLMVEGQIYEGMSDGLYRTPQYTEPYISAVKGNTAVRGGHVLQRHQWGRDRQWQFQSYFDVTERDGQLVKEKRRVLDGELQYHLSFNMVDVICGAGYRHSWDELRTTDFAGYDPAYDDQELWNIFAQGDVPLIEDRLRLTLGCKFEHNSYTGWEVQPTLRVLLTPSKHLSFWSAVSRAVRTPGRIERDGDVFGAVYGPTFVYSGMPSYHPPIYVMAEGNSDFDSEELWAYEIGMRWDIRDGLFFDLTLFYNDYDDVLGPDPNITIVSTDPTNPMAPLISYVPLGNNQEMQIYGLETLVRWSPCAQWSFEGWYSYLEQDRDVKQGHGFDYESYNPRHQWLIKSLWSPLPGWNFDSWIRYTAALDTLDIDSYYSLNVRIAWQVSERFEVSVAGLNLLDPNHPEMIPERGFTYFANEVPRSFMLQLRWEI